MQRKWIYILILTLLPLSVYSQFNVELRGTAPSYANVEISVYRFKDRITFTPQMLGKTLVDSKGNFDLKFFCSDTTQVYLDLETLRGFIYAVPGVKFSVLLPKYKPISLQQQLSPYFTPAYIRLYVLNRDTNSLNFVIARYDSFYHQVLHRIYKKADFSQGFVQKQIKALDSAFARYDTMRYFRMYRFYREGSLRRLYWFDNNSFAAKYFYNHDILWRNPAYMTLFNEVFKGCLDPNTSFIRVSNVLYALPKGSLSIMVDSLQKDLGQGVRRDVAQLILLKGLYDLFYEYTDLQNVIIQTLENAQGSGEYHGYFSDVISDMLMKFTALRVGFPAPNFRLSNWLGLKKSLSDFRGKFVYLNFCHPDLLSCQQQFSLLKKYSQTGPDDFVILTIVFGKSRKMFRKFAKKYQSKHWVILYGGDDKTLLHRYNVVAFPTYFIISPDGILLNNPAPSPIEDFEQVFLQEYKDWHRKHPTQPIRGKQEPEGIVPNG